jgi:hypothetical protein
LTVNGVTAPVVIVGGNTAVVDLNGLNLSVPAGTQGLDVEVKANLNNVTSAGQGGSLTNNDFKLVLTDYKYIVGNNTATDSSNAVASNAMVLVAGEPTIALASDNPAGQTSGFAGGETDMLKFTVTNGGTTSMNLKQVVLRGIYANATTTAAGVKIVDSNNNVLNTSGTNMGTSNAAFGVEFDNNYTIAAGQTASFTVRVDVASIAEGGSIRVDLAAADSAYAAANTVQPNKWAWNDGTITDYINGYLFKNLPATGKPFVR